MYPGHRIVHTIAAANNVELFFVPAGGTGRFQPMDRCIFEDLKPRARTEFARRLRRGDSETIDYAIIVEILEKCWVSIPADSVYINIYSGQTGHLGQNLPHFHIFGNRNRNRFVKIFVYYGFFIRFVFQEFVYI
ncbi:MAG: hypothetical protein LBE95_01290 [Holosporaceae bacterium]|nr:hypothetical protein [Holosporaceae bacterium]